MVSVVFVSVIIGVCLHVQFGLNKLFCLLLLSPDHSDRRGEWRCIHLYLCHFLWCDHLLSSKLLL